MNPALWFFTTILSFVLITGVTLWRLERDPLALWLGLTALPLWGWAYTLFGA
jgi:hypothetical protein